MSKNIPTLNYISTLELPPEEVAIVKYVFSKMVQYYDNPPKHLVNDVIEEYKERGEILSYEDATTKVSSNQIKQAVCDEVNEKWKEYFSKNQTRACMVKNIVHESYVNVSFPHEPIIDKDTFSKVQTKMAENSHSDSCLEDDEDELC